MLSSPCTSASARAVSAPVRRTSDWRKASALRWIWLTRTPDSEMSRTVP